MGYERGLNKILPDKSHRVTLRPVYTIQLFEPIITQTQRGEWREWIQKIGLCEPTILPYFFILLRGFKAIRQNERHFELHKQQFCWPSGGVCEKLWSEITLGWSRFVGSV